ncbi:hypothetical protein FRX31_022488 [Thalictrum thalictroides]|uniref:Uncharacterized protein n=1 Tax=Thalictrum thalictroides TaxID=46969 RepID=A0A7J6VUP1_THATH|nr:hypothetical protein FRX31_022488 [Thalictrum thalictroides]
MVVHELLANCEEIKPIVVLRSDDIIGDSEVVFKFEIKEKDLHQANSAEGFIEVSRQEHLVREDLLINLEQLVDKGRLKDCVGNKLWEIRDMLLFTSTTDLLLNESVERLQEEVSDQVFKLFSNGSAIEDVDESDELISDDDDFEDEMEIDNQPASTD